MSSLEIQIIERLALYFRSVWEDKGRRESLVGLVASLFAHLLLLSVCATIVLRYTHNSSEAILIETVYEERKDALDGPIEQVSIISGESGGAEDGTSSQGFGILKLNEVTPADPFSAVDQTTAVTPDSMKIQAPVLQVKNDFVGRSSAAKGKALGEQGGNEASERAVKLGLKWLASHQQPDGSWSFKHGDDAPGSLADCTTGATGLALLAFLGAGHTPRIGRGQSEYRQSVQRGLTFLVSKIKYSNDGGDLRGKVVANEGMYAHAIATLALCEAFAMTRDGKLKGPAQRAVDFIVSAQDKTGGGWRYEPRTRGDTTVTGWQIMALKSAKAGELKVPDETVKKAMLFLDGVQTAGGAKYLYEPGGNPASTPSITAIGLLCRMYLGWTPDVAALEQGVDYLSDLGPSPDNIYYNYYATQVLHHWGGPPWTSWNAVLRDKLVATQIQTGDAAGSWNPTGDHSGSGGKLYQTCLCVMTLEVYYRYMPMYQHGTAKNKGKSKT